MSSLTVYIACGTGNAVRSKDIKIKVVTVTQGYTQRSVSSNSITKCSAQVVYKKQKNKNKNRNIFLKILDARKPISQTAVFSLLASHGRSDKGAPLILFSKSTNPIHGASLVTKWQGICCQCNRYKFSPWVRTIPCRRK